MIWCVVENIRDDLSLTKRLESCSSLATEHQGLRENRGCPPLLLYTEFSLTITVRPFTVVTCLAFARESRTLGASDLCDGPGGFGIRKTWLPRNSSETTRSEYNVFESLSRDPNKDSVVGTRSTCNGQNSESGS